MSITSLRLQQFRSYTDDTFQFDEGVNIIVGPNASGKTNLLEAVLVTARGQSYRARDNELIAIDQPWARLDAVADDQTRVVKLETEPVFKKSFVINDQPLTRLSLQKTLPVVVFEPNHLLLLHGSPELRRSYLDDVLEETVPGYTATRRHYRRALAQRNALLKRGLFTAERQIFPWNVRLSELAGQIVRERQGLIERLNQTASQVYSQIAATKSNVSLEYDSQWHADQYESHLLKKLESQLDVDVQRGFTTTGPHRDDLIVSLGSQPAATTASRGEVRDLVLMLKIMEMNLLAEARQQTPLLLLDDVFSELDSNRRHALVKFLNGHQTMVTTTDADAVTQHFKKHANLIKLV